MQLAFRSKISKESLRSAGKYEQDLKGDEQGEVRKLQTFLFSCSVIQRMRPKQNLQGSEGGLYLFLLQTSRTPQRHVVVQPGSLSASPPAQ